jgi:hypothetical protein
MKNSWAPSDLDGSAEIFEILHSGLKVELIATPRKDFRTCRQDEYVSTVLARNIEPYDFIPVVDDITGAKSPAINKRSTQLPKETSRLISNGTHDLFGQRTFLHVAGRRRSGRPRGSILPFCRQAGGHWYQARTIRYAGGANMTDHPICPARLWLRENPTVCYRPRHSKVHLRNLG